MEKVNLLKNKNYAPKNLGEVCVLGLGKTGLEVTKYLCNLLGSRVKSVHVYAGIKTKFAMQSADKILKLGATVSFDDKLVENVYDLCVASPGISNISKLFLSAWKQCGEVVSEVEFAWRESSVFAKWIAITGTNGKTTTTSLCTHILKKAKKNVVSVGNIGKVALSAVWSDQLKSKYNRTDIYVVEVSSYQLALCSKFSPHIAVLLNITPDHISWHGSFRAYCDAKIKIFENAKIAVLNMEDPVTSKFYDQISQIDSIDQIIKNAYDASYIKCEYNGSVHQICSIEEMLLVGEHNCVNARAASSVCVSLSVPDNIIKAGITSFKPLEHRLESCGIIAGIRIFNDSKATNVDATLVAMKSFKDKNAVFLLGGKDKLTDLSELVNCAYKYLKGVICYGQSGDRFYSEFVKNKKTDNENFILKQQQNMEMAFLKALDVCSLGDYIVLSPACSSFDEFDSFEQRGIVFKKLVDSKK